jgi:hypothetical protein
VSNPAQQQVKFSVPILLIGFSNIAATTIGPPYGSDRSTQQQAPPEGGVWTDQRSSSRKEREVKSRLEMFNIGKANGPSC